MYNARIGKYVQENDLISEIDLMLKIWLSEFCYGLVTRQSQRERAAQETEELFEKIGWF